MLATEMPTPSPIETVLGSSGSVTRCSGVKDSKESSIYYFTYRGLGKYNNTLSRPCFIDREALKLC